jgi:hypothetical protein
LYSVRKTPISRKKEVVNSIELARNKFNALFAVHDAKNTRAPAQEQKPALKTIKKASLATVRNGTA